MRAILYAADKFISSFHHPPTRGDPLALQIPTAEGSVCEDNYACYQLLGITVFAENAAHVNMQGAPCWEYKIQISFLRHCYSLDHGLLKTFGIQEVNQIDLSMTAVLTATNRFIDRFYNLLIRLTMTVQQWVLFDVQGHKQSLNMLKSYC